MTECPICTDRDNIHITTITTGCCDNDMCLQCVLKLERKCCPFCRDTPFKISMGGKELSVPNTRGYTQDDDDDDDDDVPNPTVEVCIRCQDEDNTGTCETVTGFVLCPNCRYYTDHHMELIEEISDVHRLELGATYADNASFLIGYRYGIKIADIEKKKTRAELSANIERQLAVRAIRRNQMKY